MRVEARRWIDQGRIELEMARSLVESGGFSGAAFHSHQAAERMLKGLWIHSKHSASPRFHDLVELGSGLGVPEAVLAGSAPPEPRVRGVALSGRGEWDPGAQLRPRAGAGARGAGRGGGAMDGGRLGVDDAGLAKFLRRVDERFALGAAFLFGSRARGDELRESDYDLILVSEHFGELRFADRIAAVLELWDLPEGLEPLCYTPEELERKRREIGTVSEALREGRELPLE